MVGEEQTSWQPNIDELGMPGHLAWRQAQSLAKTQHYRRSRNPLAQALFRNRKQITYGKYNNVGLITLIENRHRFMSQMWWERASQLWHDDLSVGVFLHVGPSKNCNVASCKSNVVKDGHIRPKTLY
jgi:hypothetical protein